MRRSWVVVAVGLVAFVVACGGAAKAPPSPAAPTSAPSTLEERDPQTVEEAQARIARARTALGTEEGKTVAPLEAGAAECADACRAIASMRRAVDALCRLSGDDDPRCKDARSTLQDGEARVVRCGC